MKENSTSPIVFNPNPIGKTLIVNELDASDLKNMLADLLNQSNILLDIPDFEIGINQAEILLGVSSPTIKKYMDEGLLNNVSTDARRAKFRFHEVVNLRRDNVKYQRFRTLK